MSFTTHSTTFTMNYWLLGSVWAPRHRIWVARGPSSGDGRDDVGVDGNGELPGRGDHDDHLTSYLDRMRNLETDNGRLESKIREHLEKMGPQSNIHGLCKVIDDTSVTRLQLGTEIKALKEELLFVKNHEEYVNGLEGQIATSGLTVEVKLEAEIATYHHLLEDHEDFSLSDTLDSSNSMQTTQKITTHRLVDSKVTSETNDTNVLRL
ncbi:Keratin, type I cytoskeletal 18 [Tupaia chinensis]|uniref:Keratin, type I cytoskeletal 18 n=1 Tax=Tupaia chinensis TaxID=246437 RepID=L9L2V3_TUPCH|nr:Keratin, type I cytoskeletal 18 [Tupaia chinensis]